MAAAAPGWQARWSRRLQGRGRYAVSLAEQGFASILNLLLSLWLIRRAGAAEFGVFVLWNNIALIMSSVQNAATVCHLQALAPGADHRAARAAPERLLLAVNTLLLVVCGLAVAAAWGIVGGSSLVPMAAIAFTPAFLLYQYARALAFTRGAVAWAAGTTLCVLVGSTVLFAATWQAGIIPRAGVTLGLLATAYGLAGAVSLARLTPGLRLSLPWRDLRAYGSYVRDSLWVLLGVGSTEVIARFYAFIVTAWFGPAALGTLSAAQVLLRPAILAVNAWGWVARADMAARRQDADWTGFVRSLLRGVAGVLLISLPWGFCVWWFWPLVSRWLLCGAICRDRLDRAAVGVLGRVRRHAERAVAGIPGAAGLPGACLRRSGGCDRVGRCDHPAAARAALSLCRGRPDGRPGAGSGPAGAVFVAHDPKAATGPGDRSGTGGLISARPAARP